MATGWVKDKIWYYLNESGSMATGWVKEKAYSRMVLLK